MNVTVNKLSDAGAAEILGLDCSQPLDAETLSALKRTMLEYPVTAIRAQTLTPITRIPGPHRLYASG
jgi:alpha-ketoglutarate-dependent taurine dioxygenase